MRTDVGTLDFSVVFAVVLNCELLKALNLFEKVSRENSKVNVLKNIFPSSMMTIVTRASVLLSVRTCHKLETSEKSFHYSNHQKLLPSREGIPSNLSEPHSTLSPPP
jgi:hypothetical protein